MPRSKRNKQIELAKTKKRGLEWKKRLFEEVRSCVDKYENVFIFSVSDMRNNKMKFVREQWKHSRFFIGKNKIMAMALGRFAEEEYKPNLHKLGQQIKGQRGLLFSNKPVQEVLSWFRSYSEGDYARSGNTATETIHLPAGPLTMFPHNLEPYLRELGLPTTLEKGVIHLVKDHEVCKAGDVLTPETAKIIKLLGYEMAEFHLKIDCVWSKDGTFLQITESIDTDTKEKKKQKSKLSVSSEIKEENNEVEDEQMEVEQNDQESSDSEENDDDDEESKEVKNSASDSYCLPALDQSEEVENNASDSFTLPDIVKSSNIVATTSTPKAKSDDVVENGTSGIKEKDNTAPLECSIEEVSEKIDDRNDIEEISEVTNNKNDMEEVSEETNNKNDREKISEETDNKNDREKISEETDNKNDREKISEETDNKNDTEKISEETDNKNGIEEIDSENHMGEMSEKTDAKAEEIEEKAPTSKRGRPRVSAKTPRTAKKQTKRDSLCKTPDPNTSQDSPVFRELRNRSVKFSRKKKK